MGFPGENLGLAGRSKMLKMRFLHYGRQGCETFGRAKVKTDKSKELFSHLGEIDKLTGLESTRTFALSAA